MLLARPCVWRCVKALPLAGVVEEAQALESNILDGILTPPLANCCPLATYLTALIFYHLWERGWY